VRSYVIISSVLILIFTVCSIIAVMSRRGVGRLHLLFTSFATSVLLWCIPYLCWQLSTNEADALKWCRMLVAGSILIPVAYAHFVNRLTESESGRVLRACDLIALALLVCSQSPLIVSTVEARGGFDYWPVAGPVFLPYLSFFIGVTCFCFRLLLNHYKRSSKQGKNQLKYLIWGTAAGYVGGSTNFFLWLNIPIPPIGQGLCIFYIVGIGYSIIKFRLMEFNSMVVRVGGFLVGSTGMAFVGAVITQWMWQVLNPQAASPSLYSWWTMLTFVVLFIFPVLLFLLRRFDGFVENRVLTRASGYRAELREVAGGLFNLDEEGTIFRKTVSSLQRILRLKKVALFCRNELDERFILREQVGLRLNDAGSEETVKSALAFLRAQFEHRNDAASIEELRDKSLYSNEAIDSLFDRDDLAVPIRAGGVLLGFIIIGLRNNREIYSALDVAILEGIAFQLGLAIRARQLERQANQSEKLIALGTLAAGLAHEIRNPLVSIRTFSSLIEEQGGDPEFRREFHGVVERDVNRIGSIIDHVAAFAENSQVKFAPVQLSEVINGVYDIARPEFTRGHVRLEVTPANIPDVPANYGQLVQVFLNLFQNAIQAMDGRPDSCIKISFQPVTPERGKRAVLVTIADNGPGIDETVRARIFDPFVTTKSTGDGGKNRGMGLGLAIVKRIVDGHGGSINVSSQPGRGTTFFVQLPCVKF
jgi:two-component system nitrogen regulation sensor histidine kinase GlnL